MGGRSGMVGGFLSDDGNGSIWLSGIVEGRLMPM